METLIGDDAALRGVASAGDAARGSVPARIDDAYLLRRRKRLDFGVGRVGSGGRRP
jgi:hypothetical protein